MHVVCTGDVDVDVEVVAVAVVVVVLVVVVVTLVVVVVVVVTVVVVTAVVVVAVVLVVMVAVLVVVVVVQSHRRLNVPPPLTVQRSCTSHTRWDTHRPRSRLWLFLHVVHVDVGVLPAPDGSTTMLQAWQLGAHVQARPLWPSFLPTHRSTSGTVLVDVDVVVVVILDVRVVWPMPRHMR